MSERPPSETVASNAAYRVLARKYRPQSLSDLIGQEPMVRTLTNAFRSGRIAQAYLLTGVRGVGKTSTARILARALNYSKPGSEDRPTIELAELGEHCAAIMEGRHIDVIEMDAASHTGIGDIREIIEAVRYKPAVARYKVYIIDEVHMLSTQAFNGLLKTLEEPPEHVKFIFATTEVRKIPVTILSRCQRFDLRRIEADRLVSLLTEIAAKENIPVDDEALAMIARAAEGSARDALSLLDQVIAHGAGTDSKQQAEPVRSKDVRSMLGLADRSRIIDLFQQLARGEATTALGTLSDLYDVGADPISVLEDLADFTHLVTRLKVTPSAGDDTSLTEDERRRGTELAVRLSIRQLSRCWQILLKGIEEAREAPRPGAAAEMVLVRLAYVADLPTSDEAIRELSRRHRGGDDRAPASQPAGAPSDDTARSFAAPAGRWPASSTSAAARVALNQAAETDIADPIGGESPTARLETFADLVALAGDRRDLPLKYGLERFVRLERFEPGRIQLGLTDEAPTTFASDLGARLIDWTGQRWVVTIDRDATEPTLFERRSTAKARLVDDARRVPIVGAVLELFPGSQIVDIRVTGSDIGPDINADYEEDRMPTESDGD